MADLIDRQAVQELVDRIGDIYPYRQIGNRESYSQYNEAWTDAINRVDAELNSLPSADAVEIVQKGKPMVDIKKYLAQTRTVLLTQEAFDELVKKASADAVEVVRCADCKHSYESVAGWICSYGVCVDCVVRDDFYCSYGERKDD